jgi:hypothetical protein
LEALGTGVGFGLCDFAVVGTLFAIIRTASILLAQAAAAVSVTPLSILAESSAVSHGLGRTLILHVAPWCISPPFAVCTSL